MNTRFEFQSYYKLPAAQTPLENCVAHNGSLIPIPGRDVMIQGWYQGGISLFDWTDPRNPNPWSAALDTFHRPGLTRRACASSVFPSEAYSHGRSATTVATPSSQYHPDHPGSLWAVTHHAFLPLGA